MTFQAEENLSRLGIDLPAVAVPVANYVGWIAGGKTVHVSEQLPSTYSPD